ncbi:uncharacterized protein YOL118C [Saccharomyces cerevisiae S288C]|uniref:Uncharacterized protein YOL118C n=1 Tax=Saccharomyces cerevisiae (strain ATCC 204508 / S288c) TaxID=559292 RepID=YOL18_YEAST|eukprot:NP_001335812.1 hypothetical protein YOL118C [Saccharomyces cerevisiae S288C]
MSFRKKKLKPPAGSQFIINDSIMSYIDRTKTLIRMIGCKNQYIKARMKDKTFFYTKQFRTAKNKFFFHLYHWEATHINVDHYICTCHPIFWGSIGQKLRRSA